MAAVPLITLGYEGLSLRSFLRELQRSHVQKVVDVRELPLSRKRGFSKTALSSALDSADIRYEHVRALGCPREIRARYKRDRDWTTYRTGFEHYLATHLDAVASIVQSTKRERICLVCFEADFRLCHRSLVAAAAEAMGAGRAIHLIPRKARPDGARVLCPSSADI